MSSLLPRLQSGLKRRWLHTRSNHRLARLEEAVERAAQPPASAGMRPVVFFHASTRILGTSLNAGFQAAAAWALRMRGVPVIHFACQAGLSRCVLGAALNGPQALPPCSGCIAQSHSAFPSNRTHWFIYRPDPALETALANQPVPALAEFTWEQMPLGALCLPALRWTLRRHHLVDDAETRELFRQYILSAWRVAEEFAALLEKERPQAVVVFNGMFYPEAAARWIARERFHLPVTSHEVGLRPFTAFFTPGDATAYPIQIPDSFQLTPEQDKHLNAYLEERLKGNFTMAGIRFWPEMRGLDEAFLGKLTGFKHLVPVFTNVIFDTSQPHSNVVFPHMFAWLDQVLETAQNHPETLFVIRAHPDEIRPGKAAREDVASWARERAIQRLPNVHFVPSGETISSYELIQRARFVMVYNSTIGLEASLMGAAVLCAGKARFTQLPTVFFPQTIAEYRRVSAEFLTSERINIPPEFRLNARRFLYYQLYKTSLPFDAWLEEDGVWPGYVRFKNLTAAAFDPAHAPILRIITDGILTGSPFVLED